MRVLMLILIGLSVQACGVRNQVCHGNDIKTFCEEFIGRDSNDDVQRLNEENEKRRKENEEAMDEIDKINEKYNGILDKVGQLESVLESYEIRIALLESLSELNKLAIESNSVAVEEIIVPDLQPLTDQLYALSDYTEDQLEDVQDELSSIASEISVLETTIKTNDEYVNIPGCEHSYFVLYNANSSINQVYVTENDGTVGGSWILKNNKTYSLLIDGQTVCTGVKYSKSQKKLYFNNGSANEIDLSY